jgi:hypothetical protein
MLLLSFEALDHGMIGRGRGGETARSLIHNPIGATVVCGLGHKVEAPENMRLGPIHARPIDRQIRQLVHGIFLPTSDDYNAKKI